MPIQKGRSRALRSLMDAALEKGPPWASCHVFRWLKCYNSFSYDGTQAAMVKEAQRSGARAYVNKLYRVENIGPPVRSELNREDRES